MDPLPIVWSMKNLVSLFKAVCVVGFPKFGALLLASLCVLGAFSTLKACLFPSWITLPSLVALGHTVWPFEGFQRFVCTGPHSVGMRRG